MTSTRIAAVSTDGFTVDDHFGKAQRFLIYDLDDRLTFVEERSAEPLSVGDPGHAFDADKFKRILSMLRDCSKVYVTQIGELPAARLKASGIEPVVYTGAIGAIRL
jgi:predicted Fe-Mo cluster-binding NifX family protein